MATALLDAEPDKGYPPVPSGFLDAETAWRHLFEALAGIPRGERDPEALLARHRSSRRRTPAWRDRQTRRAGRRIGSSAGSLPAGRAPDRTTGACWASRQCSTAGLPPLARAQPVLLLVIDAMSMAVYRELERDLVWRGWVELVAEETPERPVVIAALPMVTEISRTSLLCGAIRSGNSSTEKDGFSAHPGLCSACAPAAPPVLFHKGDLREVGAAGLAPGVAGSIADPDQRIVGVVINAVDDHLAKGDQVRVSWTARHIRPMEELLEACRSAGRVVVLVSDHGHVLERETELRDVEGAER